MSQKPDEKALRRASVVRVVQRREADRLAWNEWGVSQPSGDPRWTRLLDRACELALAHGAIYPGPATARQILASEFQEVSSDEYAQVYFDVYDRCLALIQAAGEFAERYRSKQVSELDALWQLREQLPDFSTSTYEKAFGRGLFATR